MLSEADAAAGSSLDRPRARALYLAVLARDPHDEGAAIGLARADAADGCLALAKAGFSGVARRVPGHVEANAGLADVLVSEGRWREAERVLDEALLHQPFAPELLSRRARVAYFRGDANLAITIYDEAARASPLDPEIQAARQRLILGQARLGQRIQVFPSGYDDLSTTDVAAMHRWQKFRFEGGATVMTRRGASRSTRSGDRRTTITDGRPWVGLYRHFGDGSWAGGMIGVSAPALAMPRWAYTIQAGTVLTARLAVQGSLALWRYRDDRDVVIASPSLTYAVSESLDVTARYWLTTVLIAGGEGSTVHSAGLRVGWRPRPDTQVGLDYTYGVQLERNPTASELVDLRSHIVSLFALHAFDRAWGVDGALSVERRASSSGRTPDVFGPAIEAGIFVRW